MLKILHSKVFVRYFILFIILILCITILVSILLYNQFEKASIEQIKDISNASLEQTDFAIKSLSDSFYRMAMEIYFDPAIKPLWQGNKNIDQTLFYKSIYQLRFYQTIYPYINSIYLFNKDAKKVYTTWPTSSYDISSFTDEEAVFMYNNLETINPNFIPRITPSDFENDIPCYSIFVYDKSATEFEQHNVIVLNIDASYVSSYMQSVNDDKENNNSYLINNNGTIIACHDPSLVLSKIKSFEEINSKLIVPEATGYLEKEIDGTKKFISYINSSFDGWYIIQISSYSLLSNKIREIRKVTILICLAVIFLGVIISVYASIRLAKPVDALTDKVNKLSLERLNNLYDLQQQYIRSMILYGSQNSKEDIINRMSNLEIMLNLDSKYNICLFIIDDYKTKLEQKNSEYISSIKYGIIKIIDQELQKHFKFNTIQCLDLYDERLLLLINKDNFSILIDNNYAVIKHINLLTEEQYNITISSVLYSAEEGLLNIHNIINDVMELKSYRFLLGYSSIITSSIYDGLKSCDYPLKEEKNMINSITYGQTEKALEHYNNIIFTIYKSNSPKFAHTSLQNIALSLKLLINTLKASNQELKDANEQNLIKDARYFETIMHANSYYTALIRKVSLILKNKSSNKHEKLIKKVIEIIQNEYYDHNLDLAYLARKVGLSSVYLGKIFKDYTDKYAVKYITEYRMEKSLELLVKSDKAINIIADKVGFGSMSYFCTVFKKKYKITPNEYRNQYMLHNN